MKKTQKIIRLLLNLTLISSCEILFAQIEINGQIKSSITNSNPISDIYIEQLNSKKTVVERMTMADSTGHFRLENLEPNKLYEIKISAFGYQDQIFEIKTNDGITKTTLTLSAECEFSKEKAEFDWENGQAKLLLIGSIAPIANSPSDNRFEKRFGIKYYDFGCEPPIQECVKTYNEQVFELMDEKYGVKWRKKVRSDVEYLE